MEPVGAKISCPTSVALLSPTFDISEEPSVKCMRNGSSQYIIRNPSPFTIHNADDNTSYRIVLDLRLLDINVTKIIITSSNLSDPCYGQYRAKCLSNRGQCIGRGPFRFGCECDTLARQGAHCELVDFCHLPLNAYLQKEYREELLRLNETLDGEGVCRTYQPNSHCSPSASLREITPRELNNLRRQLSVTSHGSLQNTTNHEIFTVCACNDDYYSNIYDR